MKARNLLLALGCAAAFTACTTDIEEPVVAPEPAMREVTISVEVDEPSDTRVAYTENDEETAYQFAWTKSDVLYVYYNDGTKETASGFSIDESSISEDGKKANFRGMIPDGFTGNVTMTYASKGLTKRLGEEVVQDGLTLTDLNGQTSSVAEDLASHTFLYAKANVTDGVLPNVKLQHMFSYLLLKAGLQVVQDGLTLDEENPSELRFQFSIPSLVKFTSTSYEILETKSEINKIYVKKGKLVNDCLVPIFVGPKGLKTTLPMTGYLASMSESNAATIIDQPEYTYQPGKLYVVSDTNEKWQSLTVPVPDPLTLEAIEAGTISFLNKASGPVTYKVNGVEGGEISSGSKGEIIVSKGDKVQFFGNNSKYCNGSSSNASNIQCSAPCYIYGNIMSLCASEDYGADIPKAKTLGYSAFERLFKDNTNIRNHAEKKLLLPATYLGSHCYYYMFQGCTGLTEAPDLLAKNLYDYCYYGMFVDCKNLTKVPKVLPSTNLRENCYAYMFFNCQSLTTAPLLPASKLVTYCYSNMFEYCLNLSSLTCLASEFKASDFEDWLRHTHEGFFYGADYKEKDWPRNDSGIPTYWKYFGIDISTYEY